MPRARAPAEAPGRRVHEGDEAAAVDEAGPRLQDARCLEPAASIVGEREGTIEGLRDGVQERAYTSHMLH